MMDNNNRIYQLSSDQLNIISSDLIEAIILIAGKQDKTGLLQELSNVNTSILISKEELNDKLSVLDKYFVKLSTIQKEVIGDKGLKKQSKEIVKLITDDFIKIKGQIEELQKKEAETFEKRIERIEKLKGNNTLELQKVIDDFETKWQKNLKKCWNKKKNTKIKLIL